MILDEVKEEYIKDLVHKNQREDGRGFMEYRPIRIEKNVVPNAEGSALAYIGNTKVIAGIKIDVAEPFQDRPDEGVVIVNSEFSPIAHPDFEPGPPNENSIELARVVDRGIRSAEVIDPKKLFLEEDKVLGVFIDLYILDHNGNLTDTSALAAIAALQCARVPRYEGGKLVREESKGNLELQKTVVTTTFERISGKNLLDATNQEEIASDGRLSLATCDDNIICAGQKSGRAGFSKDEYLQLIDASLEKRKILLEALQG